jgi:hypothetical protein
MYYTIEPFYILEVLAYSKTEITYHYSYHGRKSPRYTSKLEYSDSGRKFFMAALHNIDIFINDMQVG